MKANLITLLFLVVVFQGVHAQVRRIGFGLNASLDFPKALLEKGNPGEGSGEISYSGGLRVFFSGRSRLQFVTGIDYQAVRFSVIDYESITFGCDHDGNGGFIVTNSWIDGDYTRQFIGIPVEARIRLVGQENHLFLKAGGKGLFWVKDAQDARFFACQTASSDSAINPFLEDPDKVAGLATFGLGIRAGTGQFAGITLNAKMDYYLSDVYRTNETRARLIAAGVELGYTF